MPSAATANNTAPPKTARERKPSSSAPITDFQEPVGPPGISRPKHKRTVTGFGPQEIKSIEASVPEPQRAAWRKHSAREFTTADQFEDAFVRHIETTLARSLYNCDEYAAYAGTVSTIRPNLTTQ